MFPKTGRDVPHVRSLPSQTDYAVEISAALRAEFGEGTGAVKRVMRWTGTCDRTARSWLHGEGAPSGLHLACLARHSDKVLQAFLQLAGRSQLRLALDLEAVDRALQAAARTLERLRP